MFVAERRQLVAVLAAQVTGGGRAANPLDATDTVVLDPESVEVLIELLQTGLIENAAERGEQGLTALRQMQAAHPQTVVDVRGLGLMLALELATPEAAEALEHEAFRRGLLVLGCGHKSVRLSPPLIIDEAKIPFLMLGLSGIILSPPGVLVY